MGPRPSGGVGGTRQGVKCLHAHLAYFLAGGDDPVGAHVARRLASDPAATGEVVAAFDCGTNSTRLLVSAGDSVPLARRMRITRLGEGVDAAGHLAPGAIERTLDALAAYKALADELGWEFVRDAARWLYDESRHMTMGLERLDAWGFERARVPLGSYIYEACAGEDALYRLGMLGYYETKNIGKKDVAKAKIELLVHALRLDGRGDLAAEVEQLAQAF